MEDLFYYQKLKAAMESKADPEKAKKMKAYMKDHFEFLGVGSPERKEIVRDIIRELGKPDIPVLMGLTGLLWSDPNREMQYIVMDISNSYLKKLEKAFVYFYDKLIGQKSWWDSVDWLAPKAMGTLFMNYPDIKMDFIEKWMNSENKWYIRSAILFQLHYKTNTDFDLLSTLILRTTGSKEFFINKASGWALREYSKNDSTTVIQFIETHPELSNLTKREGLKWLINKGIYQN